MSEGANPVVPGGFAPGSRIAGYLLEEQIGQGGMAVVFRAHDERLERTVALKILAPALAADEAFRQRFIRESRAAAAVDDPHIIPVFEAGEASGVLFIAMRFVRGGDVRSLVSQYGPMPPGRATEIVSQVASALDAAHGRGLVHRDVKPANMLLDASSGAAGRPDHVYLSDFGLSKGSLQASGLTGTGTFLGTLDYISPEQIEGKPVDGRADEYALACAGFELLTGVPPFQRDEAMAVMYAQLSEPPPPVTRYRPELPPAVDAVFARALAKTASERYATCRDFTNALRDSLGIRPYDSGPGLVPSGEHPATQVVRPSGPGQQGTWPGGGPSGPPSGPPARPTAGAGAGVGQFGTAETQVAGGGTPTSTDLTEQHWQGSGGGGGGHGGGGRPVRPWWRSWFALAAVIAILAAGGVAYAALSGGGSGGGGGGGNSGQDKSHVTALKAPGCSTAAAAGHTVQAKAQVTSSQDGKPFGIVPSKDGKVVFVITDRWLSVYKPGPGQTLTYGWHYPVGGNPGVATTAVLTSDGKYLLIAADNGIEVMDAAAAQSGAYSANLVTLQVPGMSSGKDQRAIGVAVTPDGKYAFVSLQFANEIAVFDLAKAVSTRVSDASDYLGSVKVGDQPVGLTMSPDGQTLYATNFVNSHASVPGTLSVIDVGKAVTNGQQKSAVVSAVQTGCGPARVAVTPDNGTVWVTLRQSDAVLGYSASLLRSDTKTALKAKVLIGREPVGIALVNGGGRVLAADTDSNNIAVVNASAAMSGKPALLGYIGTGLNPHEVAVSPDGKLAYVSVRDATQIQVIRLSTIP